MAKSKTIKLTDKKGNFLNLLRGLFKIVHYKGKDLSFITAENLLVLQDALEGLIFDNPSEDYKLLVMKAQELAKSEDEDVKAKIEKLEADNQDVINRRQEQLAVVKEELDEEVELELQPIAKKLLPEDIDAEILLHIKQLVK